MTSETIKALFPDRVEECLWYGSTYQTQLLATVCDHLANISYILAASNSKHPKRIPKPDPIPRPGIKLREKKKYGSDAIPISEWDMWWNSKGGE